MPKLKLTTRAIERLPAPDPSGKQTLYWDTDLKGFGVLCSGKTGAKTYVVQRDLPNGGSRRITVAPTNVLDLDKARHRAELVLAEMYQGVDPKAARLAAAAAATTLRQTLDAYLKARKDLRPKSRADYEASIAVSLADWLDRPLRDITPDMVEERHRQIQKEVAERARRDAALRAVAAPARKLLRLAERAGDKRPAKAIIDTLKAALKAGDAKAISEKAGALQHAAVAAGIITAAEARQIATADPAPTAAFEKNGHATANAAMRALRALWYFAAERMPDLPANPVRRLKRGWFPVERRERLVRSDELPAFYAAVNALPNPTARDYLLLLLFTGLRRTEAATLRWQDVDFTDRVLRLPAKSTKAGRKLDLPMTDFVRSLLVARRAQGRDGPYVFPSDGKSGHIAEPRFPLEAVAQACGVRVSAHDLRRTFVTVAEATEISVMALKALVNHAQGRDVTAGYVMLTPERLREPAQRVCDRMKALCGVPAAPAQENVSTLAS
jgi:integrase